MKTVVVRNIKRTDAELVKRLGALGLVFAAGFYFFQGGARFFPGKLAFPTFAV